MQLTTSCIYQFATTVARRPIEIIEQFNSTFDLLLPAGEMELEGFRKDGHVTWISGVCIMHSFLHCLGLQPGMLLLTFFRLALVEKKNHKDYHLIEIKTVCAKLSARDLKPVPLAVHFLDSPGRIFHPWVSKLPGETNF